MDNITSRDNAYVRQARRLLAETKYRRRTGLFALEGARLCGDAVRSGADLRYVLFTKRAAEVYADTLQALRGVCGFCTEISETLAAYISDTASPQGLFCVCQGVDKPAGLDTIEKNGKYLALENVQDPSNLGAIIRTAEALGIHGLILSAGCCDRYNPKVLRASMGGALRLPIVETDDLPAALDHLQRERMAAFASVVHGDALPVQQARFAPGSIAVIGNEGSGLTPEAVQSCRHRITIRMPGRAESLNASVAASLIAWEMMRGDTAAEGYCRR